MRKALLCLVSALSMLFTGCMSEGFAVDNLLVAPKLSEEQTKIYDALIDSVGKSITLKYPKSGEYRSAFVISNIDSEPDDEAVVFYESNTTTSMDQSTGGVRINILNKVDDEWYSVYDHAAFGTDVDKVLIGRFGDDNQIKVIVGYNVLNYEEKTLQVFTFNNNKFESIFNDNYTTLDIIDIDKDGNNELVIVTNAASTTPKLENVPSNPEVRIYKASNGQILLFQKSLLNSGANLHASTVQGFIKDPSNEDEVIDAIFVDSVKSSGVYTTEIIYYANDALNTITFDNAEVSTARPYGYSSIDIDRDQIVEIPVTKPFIGYEDQGKDASVLMTDWCVYDGKGSLERKYSSYYNPSYGYSFTMPGRWLAKDSVTMKWDTATDEAVFYKYEGHLGWDMVELMRILVTTRKNTSEKVEEGYQVFGSKGQIDYLIKIPKVRGEELILTVSEVRQNFNVVGF